MDRKDSRRLTSTLEHLATQGADATRIAAVVVSAWTEIEATLAPVIGSGGVAALFERTLHLTRASHPWLATMPENADARMDLPALEAVLAKQRSAMAASAGGAQLQAFYELLGSLIGTSLTGQLLGPVWTNSFGGTPAQDLST